MYTPIESGGPAVFEGDSLFLEEMPSDRRSSILNGWIFALFGIYDFWLATRDQHAYDLFNLSLGTLKLNLEIYDAGYWSYYDALGHMSSLFYHNLHICQLTALSMIDDDGLITKIRNRWIRYRESKKKRAKAFIVKVMQKLREPGKVVIVR